MSCSSVGSNTLVGNGVGVTVAGNQTVVGWLYLKEGDVVATGVGNSPAQALNARMSMGRIMILVTLPDPIM